MSDAQKPGPGPSGMRFAGLGVQLAASLLLFVLGGQWLDRRLGTGALFTILGAFLGFGGTMYSLIRTLNAGNGGNGGGDSKTKGGDGNAGGPTGPAR